MIAILSEIPPMLEQELHLSAVSLIICFSHYKLAWTNLCKVAHGTEARFSTGLRTCSCFKLAIIAFSVLLSEISLLSISTVISLILVSVTLPRTLSKIESP